jgi:Mg-chelatase subunit ChlD
VPLTRGTPLEQTALNLRYVAATAIIQRARHVLGSISHPTHQHNSSLDQLPVDATQVELQVENTIESAPLVMANIINEIDIEVPLHSHDIWMKYEVHKKKSLIICMDMSLSMMGEKQVLMAVAIVAVLFKFPMDMISILGFDDETHIFLRPCEKVSILEIVERILDSPGRPYTNIEAGLRKAREIANNDFRGEQCQPVSTILLSDGKYTSGADPIHIAPYFNHLTVLKIGHDHSGIELCQDLAQKGKGTMCEIPCFEKLPIIMYKVAHELLRGHAL